MKVEKMQREPFDYDAFNTHLSDHMKFAIEYGVDVSDDELPTAARPGETVSENLDNLIKGLKITRNLLAEATKNNITRGDIGAAEIFTSDMNRLNNLLKDLGHDDFLEESNI